MTDVLELLKQADPVDAAQLRRETPPQGRLDAILADAPRVTGRRGSRRSLTRVLVLAGGLASIGAITLALVAGGDHVDTAAAAALHKIANVARAQPPTLAPGHHRFLYVRNDGEGFLAMASKPPFHRGIRSTDDFGFLLDFRSTQEVWIGENGGRVRNRASTPTFPMPRDRQAWEAAGRPKLPPAYDDEMPLNSGIERLDIPTDPDALLAYLRRRAAESDEGNAWIFTSLITDYLREWGVTNAQRAALFEAAARLPGIELLGKRTDPDGRAGVGFAMDDEHEHARHTLIIDRDTGQLLAQISETLPGGPIPAGARSYTTFSSPVLVEAAGERPAG
jgi:hypothetical protein